MNGMQCQKCGSEVRPNSRFCHICGTPIKLVNPDKGGNFIRVAFVFVGVIPGLITVIEIILAMISKSLSLPMIFDLLVVMCALTFFSLIYRGRRWAILPIGLLLIIPSLVKLTFLLIAYKMSFYSLYGAFFSIMYIAFGIYLMRSKDVIEFIKKRAIKSG